MAPSQTDPAAPDQALFDTYQRLINPAYPQFLTKLGLDRAAAKAEGATIADTAGRTFIDCTAGYGLFNLGHNHPRLIADLTAQLGQNQLYTRPLITDLPAELATKLAAIAPGELSCSLICNSGSEAIDSALKLVRLNSRRKRIVSAKDSWHGYTFGALSVSGIDSFKRLFAPLLDEVEQVPFDDVSALEAALGDHTAALVLEVVQHEAGLAVPDPAYLAEARRLCDETGTLLILDEIKTGFGRTGEMFACNRHGVVPDILVLGKAMGGGLVSTGAVVAKPELWRRFGLSFTMSASSSAGNVLACRAALSTIEIVEAENLAAAAADKGAYLLTELQRIAAQYPDIISAVDGVGLLIGATTAGPQKTLALSRALVERGVLAVAAFGNATVLMIEPPLVIAQSQAEAVIAAVEDACAALQQSG